MTALWIVPTRGRPDAAADLHEQWARMAVDSDILFVVDAHDPAQPDYRALHREGLPVRYITERHGRGMAVPLNIVARAEAGRYDHLGFMGDDHRPRTIGFDVRLASAAGSEGITYGDDLYRGRGLASAWLMSSVFVRRLGWMTPPCLRHMYLDRFVMALGEELGALAYLPEVVVEHVHPDAGKAERDAGYDATVGLMGPDGDAWRDYRGSQQFVEDAERARG